MASRKKILIFRPDNIGDVVLFSGALKYFRQLFPTAEISLAVRQNVINLVEMCPYVDQVLPVESLATSETPLVPCSPLTILRRAVKGLDRILRIRFDVVLYPVRAPQSIHLAILRRVPAKSVFGIIGCQINASAGYPQDVRPDEILTNKLDVSGRDPWEHEFEVLQLFLNQFGAQISGRDQLLPEFWFSPEDQSLLPTTVLTAGPVLGLFPFASGPERCWPVDRYLPLLQRLPGLRTAVLLGGPENIPESFLLQQELQAGVDKVDVINLVGRTTLRQLVMTIADCSAVVSVDSCGLHMSIANGVPTVGIVAGGHYGMFIPWGDLKLTAILTNRLDCFNCNWKCWRATHECIEKITPGDVADAVEKLMKQTGLYRS